MANNVMNNEGTPTTGIQNIYYAVNLWFSDNAQALLDYGPISDWNTTACIHMGWLFFTPANDTEGRATFNEDISSWNTSNVINMASMFRNSFAFDQDIGNWNTSNVINMASMFRNSFAFDQDIGNWNTAAVTDMNDMFRFALAFNQNIGSWNTAAVTDMHGIFRTAKAFNQDIGNWNTAAVTDMSYTFYDTTVFNQDIGSWNTAAVKNMNGMFSSASAFNNNGSATIGSWNTAAVTHMNFTFNLAYTFNQNIGSWNTASVLHINHMFKDATAFNQNIRGWNTLSGPVGNYTKMFMGATKMIETYGPTGQDLASFGTSPNYTPTSDFFNVPPEPICFPKGTPVTTDQGEIAIEKLNPDKHSIRGHNIVAITQSQPLQKHIVCFEKDSLSKKVPSQQTLCSMEHKVFYKGEMIKARNIVDLCENVTFIPYNGETLFNVLLKKHDKMMINNLICETLHPENIAAKISQMKDGQKKNKAIQELSKIIKENNVEEYKKLYASL